MKEERSIMFSYKSIYVDIDTGQVLRSKDALNKDKYIIIRTIKNTTYKNEQTKASGYITYTRECRKQPQRRIEFNI